MPRKRFTFVNFSDPLWESDLQMEEVLRVRENAPRGADRNILRTRVVRRPDSPSPAFIAYNATHDKYRRITTYRPDDSDDPSDVTEELVVVYFVPFGLYEFRDRPGHIYAETSLDNMKEMFRRHREETQALTHSFNNRVVRLPELEETLDDAEITGYSLRNVQSSTPLRRVQFEGQRISENEEVQDARERAQRIEVLDLQLQRSGLLIQVRIRDDGAITFMDYPGDTIALDIITQLDSLIRGCSDIRSIQVRQRG